MLKKKILIEIEIHKRNAHVLADINNDKGKSGFLKNTTGVYDE